MSNNSLSNIKVQEEPKYTNELIFIPGEFRLSDAESIPYFSVVMPLQDLVKQIKLVEEIPDKALLDWPLEALFQRELSKKRVETELVRQYLRDQSRLSFFNSLTIALLPRKDFEIEESYGKPDPDFNPPDKGGEYKRDKVGNICIDRLRGADIGVIRWHKDRIFPVAIDGQHRLAALKKYYEEIEENLIPSSPEIQTKISLILLILDKGVGFKRREKKTIIETLREIFIDLNKNARSVSRSRLILLEDQNIQSLCVRILLADKAKEYSENKLPLSLVTWRGDGNKDEAKFDSGYSITSVLNLNEIVNYCLNRASLKKDDPLVQTKITRYVDNIIGRLELEKNVKKSIIDHSNECIQEAEPFSFKKDHLEALKRAFREQWAPYIVRIFREFLPYKIYFSKAEEIGAVLSKSDGVGVVDDTLVDYLLLPDEKDRREKFIERKKTEYSIKNNKFLASVQIHNPLKELADLKTNEWAFQVVFQKALFINFFDLESQKEVVFGRSFKNKEDFYTWWIAQINALYEKGVFHLHWRARKGKADLWLGIANNPGSGSIQYTQAAANRISSFISICICFLQPDLTQEATEFVDNLNNSNDQKYLIAQEALRNIRRELVSLIGAKMDVDEIEDSNKLEKQVKKELIKRLNAIQD